MLNTELIVHMGFCLIQNIMYSIIVWRSSNLYSI